MNSNEHLLGLIKGGENIHVEFKESNHKINKSVYITVCAFLNRHGGTIILGVDALGNLTGVEPHSIVTMRREFATVVNNPEKINPPCYLSIDEHDIDGKKILHIFVPESSQVHRCQGKIYDRNEDCDVDITNNTRAVSAMYQRKQTTYSENKIYPHADMNLLRKDIFERVRIRATAQRKDHPWNNLTNEELLKSAQLLLTDPETGKSGITLAGILLFGSDNLILSAAPHHRTDLILRKTNIDRYDDRDLVRTNLLDSYDRIMAFVNKHLPDPFYLEGTVRMNIRDIIFREVAANLLIHREYLNPYPAKLIIEKGVIRTENSNKPHGSGPINPTDFSPYPKNPTIAKFFHEIGLAEELGSGVRNIVTYGKIYGNKSPELIEGDVFQVKIYSQQDTNEEVITAPRPQSRPQSRPESRPESELANRIISALKVKPLGSSEIASSLGHKSVSGALKIQIKELLSQGLIEMTIPEIPNSRLQKYRLVER